MSPAFVFVVPAVVTAVLAVVTGLAYARTRTAYLLWWAVVWGLAVVYYLTFISSSMAGSQQTDIFANIGVVTAALGWARVVGLWSGARLLVNRPVSRRTWGVLLPVSFVWLVLLTGLLADQPFTPALTRLSFAFWYLLGAAELLLRPPRTMVGIFCGSALLLLGMFGLVASQFVVDLTGSMLTNWGLTALFLALGLGVLGRLLEEERERAAAHSRELAAANARLAELDQLKDDFVSMISHELRTPLGLIKGYAGTLLQPELVHDESTRKEFLTVIDEETDRLTELVSNLLDMSRIEAGTLRMDLQPTDLQHLLVDCSARLRAREPGRALDLQVEVEPELPVMARLKPGQAAVIFVADVPEGISGQLSDVEAGRVRLQFVKTAGGRTSAAARGACKRRRGISGTDPIADPCRRQCGTRCDHSDQIAGRRRTHGSEIHRGRQRK